MSTCVPPLVPPASPTPPTPSFYIVRVGNFIEPLCWSLLNPSTPSIMTLFWQTIQKNPSIKSLTSPSFSHAALKQTYPCAIDYSYRRWYATLTAQEARECELTIITAGLALAPTSYRQLWPAMVPLNGEYGEYEPDHDNAPAFEIINVITGGIGCKPAIYLLLLERLYFWDIPSDIIELLTEYIELARVTTLLSHFLPKK